LALKTIGISILSISVLVSFGLTSNQAFAGGFDLPFPQSCADCIELKQFFEQNCVNGASSQSQIINCDDITRNLRDCAAFICPAAPVGGDMIQMQTTSILAAGAQYTAAWMIPVLVSSIGIGIVIARKF